MKRARSAKRLAYATFVGLAASAFGTPASANALHYFTQDNFLYWYNDVDQTTTSVELKLNGVSFATAAEGRFTALAFDPAGTLWGSTAVGKMYTIDIGSGAVTYKFQPTTNVIPTMDFRRNGNTLEILATKTGSNGASSFVKYDAANGTQIGSDKNLNSGVPLNYAGHPASGYDGSATYYIVRGGAGQNESQDFSLSAYDLGTDTAGTYQDTGLTWSSAAGAWFEGALRFGYRPGEFVSSGNWKLPAGSSDVYFGRLDLTNGDFTQEFVIANLAVGLFPLSNGIATGPSFGYAVAPIPEADSYALMFLGIGLAGFLARRRR